MQYNITYRKKDNSWQYIISYKDSTGKWRQKSKQGFELSRKGKELCKIEAENKIEELKKMHECIDIPELRDITFEKYTKLFIEHQKLYKEPNTIEHYKLTFNIFNDLNDLRMIDIKNFNVQKSIDDLIKKGYSQISIKGFLSSLRYTFNYAIKKDRIIIENPVRDIDYKIEKEKKTKRALTQNELIDLLNKIKNKKLRLISMVAAKCGLRISEILGLTWSDIDMKNFILSVNKQWKKNKDGKYSFGILKSKNSKRQVPIPPNLMSELKAYKSDQKVIELNDRIFNYGSREQISSALCKTYREIGYEISVHELRHTYGTTLIANCLDFKTVAKLMGNDVKQVLDTYSHVNDDMMNSAKNLINKIL